jgi:hypothetical protein
MASQQTSQEPEDMKDAPNVEAYYAVGRFVWRYAQAETAIFVTCRKILGINLTTAHAVIGGMRASEAVSLTKRLMVVKRRSHAAVSEIQKVLDHFLLITGFRDRLVHRGFEIQVDGTFASDTELRSKSHEDVEVMAFTVADVRRATRDLNVICRRLARVLFPYYWKGAPRTVLAELHQPWHYKPVRPDTPNRPLRHKGSARPKPERRSASSQE